MTTNIFNTPFELGIRMVYLLKALYPRKVDLQTLVYLDYASIYSADLGGPSSLHTPVPLRGGEYASRREVIETGLYLMATRGFIEVSASINGIYYSLGEHGVTLIGLIGGNYSRALSERCEWVAKYLGNEETVQLAKIFNTHGTTWGAEFIGSEVEENS